MHTSIHHTQKVGKYFKLLARTQHFWMSDSPKKKTKKNQFLQKPHILSNSPVIPKQSSEL